MVEKSKMSHIPSAGAIAEAKKNPDGWVYEIRGNYGPDDFVPPHAVVGAWKVDQEGNIVGEFIRNPNFKEPDASK
jgi:hypothetical protein